MKDAHELPDVEIGDLQIETLAGDVRDELLGRIKTMKRTWSLLSQDEQHDLANGLEYDAKALVRRVVKLMTNWDAPRAVVKMDGVKFIGGDKARIEAKIEAANVPENLMVLGPNAGRLVVLVCIDSSDFMGERGPVKTDPDQPDLPGTDDSKPEPKKRGRKKAETEALPIPDDSEPKPDDGEEQDEADPEPFVVDLGNVEDAGGDIVDSDTGEVIEPETYWLRELCKLRSDEMAAIPDEVAADLIDKGFAREVSPAKGKRPAYYAATPAGRSAIEGDA